MSVQRAIEWAFATEKASLDLPDIREIEDRGFGFGTEYVLLQRARLGGVRIDGGGHSYPHDDADIIAAIITTIPDSLGGRSMAIRVADYGRAGTAPNWLPGAKTRIEPAEWKAKNRYGRWAKAEIIRRGIHEVTTPHPKNPVRSITRHIYHVEEWCPVTVIDHPQMIASARREYTRWRSALAFVRDRICESDQLCMVVVTPELPPDRPWIARN